MSKMRIYEYAKQNNTTSKAVIEQLKALQFDVKNHMSTIDSDMQQKLDQQFKKADPKPTNKKQNNKTKSKQQESRER